MSIIESIQAIIPKKEATRVLPKYINAENIPNRALPSLQQEVKAQENKLLVLVHPLFHCYHVRDIALIDSLVQGALPSDEMFFKGDHKYLIGGEKYLLEWLRMIRNPNLKIMLVAEEDKPVWFYGKGKLEQHQLTQTILRSQGFQGTIVYYLTKKGEATPTAGDYTQLYHSISSLQPDELVVTGQYGMFEPERERLGNDRFTRYFVGTGQTERAQEVGRCVQGFINNILQQSRNDQATPLKKITLSPIVYG